MASKHTNTVEENIAVLKEAEPEYFYSKHTPYKYSSGPIVSTLNPDTWAPIQTLVEAKALAERFRVRSTGDDAVTTTYGVQYKVK